MTNPALHLSHPKYRPDIDGLRAIAVLSVVAFHAFPSWMKGGFIGVDVFFVISGFLISTIIFENLDKGTFSFSEFYARHIKRIYPALLIVLTASIVFGWFSLLADEYKQLGKHTMAATGFISNFVLWSEAGYFDNSAETKPLLHLWSLGIEEQFYFIWPLLCWFFWRMKFYRLALVVGFILASFFLNLYTIKIDGVATFYSPITRFWELLFGSLLSYFSLHHKITVEEFQKNTILSNGASFLGFLILVSGFLLINKDASFPGYWALIPVIGSVLIILSGPFTILSRTILTNKVIVWFGLISFPLYLWHWPLLTFLKILGNGTTAPSLRLALMLLAVLLAWMTLRFIERPIRAGNGARTQVAILTGLMLTVGASGYVVYMKQGLVFGRQFNLAMTDAAIGAERQKYWDGSLDSHYHTGQPKVLIYGDSQAYDIYNALSNDQQIGLTLFKTSHQCSAFFALTDGEPEAVRDQCQREFDHLLNSDELKTADTLIYTHLWVASHEQPSGHKTGAQRLREKNPALKILFFGHKPLLGQNWGASINTITRDHRSRIGMNAYLDQIKNISDERYVQDMARLAGGRFVDVQSIFCDGGCQFYVNGSYSYFDFHPST